MANDSPRLAGYIFEHPPKPSNVFWKRSMVNHRLSDGVMISYTKGFIIDGELNWGKNGWIEQDDYSAIETMYNQLTGTALFYPRPDSFPTRFFRVQINNDFNFTPHGGDLQSNKQLYEGTITFESSLGEITATSTEIF